MTKERVIKTFSWFKRAMERAGRKTSFPAGTPFEKTYLYRSLKRFTEKADEWGLSDDLAILMIAIIIKWAAKKKMLHHGASLLNMNSVLEICYKEMMNQSARNEIIFKEIGRCKKFLQENSQPLLALKRGGFTNFTCWYQANRITVPFVAVSRSCCDILAQLPQNERDEFPSEFELLKNRIHLLADAESRKRIDDIMGQDLFLKGV